MKYPLADYLGYISVLCGNKLNDCIAPQYLCLNSSLEDIRLYRFRLRIVAAPVTGTALVQFVESIAYTLYRRSQIRLSYKKTVYNVPAQSNGNQNGRNMVK